MIPIAKLLIGDEQKQAVLEVLASEMLAHQGDPLLAAIESKTANRSCWAWDTDQYGSHGCTQVKTKNPFRLGVSVCYLCRFGEGLD